MSLAHDADQALYVRTVDRLLSDLPETDRVRALIGDDRAPSVEAVDRVWARLVRDLGATALPLDDGGASWREVGIVLEGVGLHLAAAPYASAMTAVRLLAALPGTASLLARAAEGHRFVLAVPATTWLVAPTIGWDGAVRETVRSVLDAAYAQTWLLPVEVDGVVRIAVTDDATVTPRAGVDVTRAIGDVTFEGGATLLDGDAADALAEALAFAATAIAVEAVGGAERCLRMTVDYVKIREQFGHPVGSYQAIKHALADVVRVLEPAKAAAYAALEAVATDDPDQPRAAALAKLTAVEAYAHTAGQAIQLHGAIGFTWEHELHLHLKRAVTDRVLFGSAPQLRRVLAVQLLDEATTGEAA